MRAERALLKQLQSSPWRKATAVLWVIESVLKKREARYSASWVKIAPELQKRLAESVAAEINRANHLRPYEYVTEDLDEGDALVLGSAEADDVRTKILPQLQDHTSAAAISSAEDLVHASSYIVELQLPGEPPLYAYKKIPEKWDSVTKNKLFAAIWSGVELQDAGDRPVFRLSHKVDSFHFRDHAFILNKKNFEVGLNFRAGMMRHAEQVVQELNGILSNPGDVLKGNEDNMRILRHLAQIMKNPLFKDPQWIAKVRELNAEHAWGLQWTEGGLVVNDANLQLILTLLRDRRARTLIYRQIIDADVARVVS